MTALKDIRDYLRLDDRLATSGMPQREQFQAIKEAGFDVVINLALPTSDYALADEGDIVTRLDMAYVHLPVNFEAPHPDEYDRFTRVLEAFSGARVWVHCVANMRVSAFVFLHRLRVGVAHRVEAERDLRRIWEPDGEWRKFINQRLAEQGLTPL